MLLTIVLYLIFFFESNNSLDNINAIIVQGDKVFTFVIYDSYKKNKNLSDSINIKI